jgi:protein-S-isoprenylcysteine O-methyltransferase Ste14
MTSPDEKYCSGCGLDPRYRTEHRDANPSWRTVIIILLIAAALALLLWFIAALGASGMSDA